MNDLTESQYLKCKPLYWGKRAGPDHCNYENGYLLWIEFGIIPPEDQGSIRDGFPGFHPWTNDLTYDELNGHNKEAWANLHQSVE